MPPAQAGCSGQVDLVEALGADTLIYVTTDRTARSVQSSRQNERTPLRAGDAVGSRSTPERRPSVRRQGASPRTGQTHEPHPLRTNLEHHDHTTSATARSPPSPARHRASALPAPRRLLAAGARVVLVDRDARRAGQACASAWATPPCRWCSTCSTRRPAPLMPERFSGSTGRLDIFHANAGLYVGGDLVDADDEAIDRMLNLNVNVVMKNVHDVLPHMIERGTGDIIVTSSLAAHFPTPVGAGLRLVQMGDRLLRADGAAPGVQARHPRRRRSRPARSSPRCWPTGRAEKLAEAARPGQPARGQRGGRGRAVHAHPRRAA